MSILSRRASRIGFSLTLVFAGMVCMHYLFTVPVATAAEPPAGTIPPVAPFSKRVVSENVVRSGGQILYELQILNLDTPAYSATIGITDTAIGQLHIVTESVQASSGVASTDGTVLSWLGDIQTGSAITINYVALAPTVTESLLITNYATLYEVRNYYVPTPTNQVSETYVVIEVRPWELFLPVVVRPKPPLPQVPNPGFEEMPNQAWTELVNGSTGKLIYSTSEFARPLRDGIRYTWLGGAANQVNEIKQSLALPAEYSHIGLRYYYWLYSEEDACNNDLARVLLNGTQIKEYQLCKQNSTYKPGAVDGWVRPILDLSLYGGQTVMLSFWSELNGSKNSNFLLDLVQLCSNDADAPADVLHCDQ